MALPLALTEPLVRADMVRIPPSLEEVVRLYTKAAIRENPASQQAMLEWSAAWFAEKAKEYANAEEPPPS